MPNWITVEESLKARERAVERERERIYDLVHRYACDDFDVEIDEPLKMSLNAIANGALASGHDYGSVDERNRIIELLKESACCQDECSFHEELTNIIALIKGEPNE